MLDWIITGIVFVGCIALAVIANAKSGEVWDEPRPRMVPWRLVMIMSAFCAILAIVHAANLAGFETGPEHAVFGNW